MKRITIFLLVAASCMLLASATLASPFWVSFNGGSIGLLDTTTGNVSDAFNPPGVDTFIDIAFDPLGDLYGIASNNLYSIDPSTNTAAPIGSWGDFNLNALVIAGDGTAYAMGADNTNLYTLNLFTAAATAVGDTAFFSKGDLEFDDMGNLYLSGYGSGYTGAFNSHLIRINSGTGASTYIGEIGFPFVFGLAFVEGTMYGVSQLDYFDIDLTTGAGGGATTGNWLGTPFSTAAGASAPAPGPGPEPVPEPCSMLLLGTGLLGLAALRKKWFRN